MFYNFRERADLKRLIIFIFYMSTSWSMLSVSAFVKLGWCVANSAFSESNCMFFFCKSDLFILIKIVSRRNPDFQIRKMCLI